MRHPITISALDAINAANAAYHYGNEAAGEGRYNTALARYNLALRLAEASGQDAALCDSIRSAIASVNVTGSL